MATFPARRESCRQVIDLILPQVDELIVYLNGYDDIPHFCLRAGVRPILGDDADGDIRDNGKFFALSELRDCFVFTFDDDIIYPTDYVRRMVYFVEMLERKCVVGVHGVDFPCGELTDLKRRAVYHFRTEQYGRFVELLGTGTTAWHSALLQPSLQDFRSTGVCDLWFARLAATSDVPMFCVPRERDWLAIIAESENTLFKEALENQQAYLSLYHSELKPIIKENGLRERKMHEMTTRYARETLLAAGFLR